MQFFSFRLYISILILLLWQANFFVTVTLAEVRFVSELHSLSAVIHTNSIQFDWGGGPVHKG